MFSLSNFGMAMEDDVSKVSHTCTRVHVALLHMYTYKVTPVHTLCSTCYSSLCVYMQMCYGFL